MLRNLIFLTIYLLTLLPTSWAASPLYYLSVGPMLHWNFNQAQFSAFSYGIEVAWWRFNQNPRYRDAWFNLPDFKLPGHGISFGIDIDKNAFRLYAEPEVGWAMAGASLGAVVEVSKENKPQKLGIQGSLWANSLIGLNLRYRYLGHEHHQALGLYTKLPIPIGGDIAYREEE